MKFSPSLCIAIVAFLTREMAAIGLVERSGISWTYYPKRVMTNEVDRSVIITCTFLATVKFVHLHLSIRTFFKQVGRKMF